MSKRRPQMLTEITVTFNLSSPLNPSSKYSDKNCDVINVIQSDL